MTFPRSAAASRLLAFQHADTAFPSGSFAFSNGIEGLAALDPGFDAAALARAVESVVRHRWAGSERVALIHAHRAWDDLARLAEIDAAVESATLAEPMRLGSRRNGSALLTAHARLGTPGAADLRAGIAAGDLLGHLPVMQGALWRALGLDTVACVEMAGYQAVAGLVAAAVRLGRIGAIAGQRILSTALPVIADVAEEPVAEGDPIALSAFAPLIEIAAMRHARADLRLFAN